MINTSELKDKAILLGWISGLLAIIALIWILTQPLQTYHLLRTVNNVLSSSGSSQRVTAHIAHNTGRTGLLGYWYTMLNSTNRMFVFAVFQDGILIPLGAVVTADGNVDDIIPLSAHAVQIYDNIPQSILQIYIERIEEASLMSAEGRSR